MAGLERQTVAPVWRFGGYTPDPIRHGLYRIARSAGRGDEHLRWRPDGSALSWSGCERSSDPASNGIWLVDRDRSAPRRIVADGYGPVWSADGDGRLFFEHSAYAGLWKYDLGQGREAEIRQWAEEQYEFDVVGDRLVYTGAALAAQELGRPDLSRRLEAAWRAPR